MAVFDLEFPSFNQRDAIKGWMFTPGRVPLAVVQIAHGWQEHSRRYLRVAQKLVDAGFAVCADDHAGHGLTGAGTGTLGDFGDKGFLATVEDELSLQRIAAKMHPGIPLVMYGHSWGSFIARSFAARYGDSLSALIISGTGAENPVLENLAPRIQKIVDEGNGKDSQQWLTVEMFGWMLNRVENPKTPYDWISNDPDVVRDFIADPGNNRDAYPTFRAVLDLCGLHEDISGIQWAQRVPKKLPIYNIAGDEDAVGNYGEGAMRVSNWLRETGHSVSSKLYPGHRHEIHHDRDIRDEVIYGVIEFINRAICRKADGWDAIV